MHRALGNSWSAHSTHSVVPSLDPLLPPIRDEMDMVLSEEDNVNDASVEQ